MTSSGGSLRESDALLHAYLDGELGASEMAAAERVIAASSELAAEAAAVCALKCALRTRLAVEILPPQFASRIARRLGLPVW
jgi:anti-sigma factor RsiW